MSEGKRHEPPRARVSVPPAGGLSRERLLRALDPVSEGGVAMVVAPAGCGKTTLMADWARRYRGAVAWYRARPDDLPQRLLDHLAVAIGIPPTEPVSDIDDVARALDQQREPRLLVLDDVHALPDRTSHAVLDALLMELPAGTSVLLGSRRAPEVDLARGELPLVPVTVTAEDLRFRSWEVESLFRDIYGSALLPEDAAGLARHTEGWAAALHLFHLSTRHTSPDARRRTIGELARHSRYARGYLSRQVLVGLGASLSGFMRRTAVFESMTGERCDALLHAKGSQRMLDDLVSRQALTTTDDAGLTFRYHEVLRRHLEADLEVELGADALRDWYARAATLLEEDGAILEAVRVRARAQDWAGVRALLVRRGSDVAARAGSWPGLVPTNLVREDPWIALAESYRLLSDGRLGPATDLASRAIVGLDDPRGHERARDLLTVTRALQTLEATPRGRWYETVAAALKELPRWASPSQAGKAPGGPLAAPFLALLRGNAGRSLSALSSARASTEEELAGTTALDLLEAALAVLGGREDARELAEMVAVSSELAQLEWFARMAQALLASGDPDPTRGRDKLNRLVAMCDRRGDAWGAAWACGIDALVRARTLWHGQPVSDTAGLLALIHTAARRFRALDAGVPEAWLTSLAAVVAARSGDDESAARAADAIEAARRVNCVGAEAWATWALAAASSDDALLKGAVSLADEAGLSFRPWSVTPCANEPSGMNGVSHGGAGVRIVLLGAFRIERAGSAVDLSDLRPQHRLLLRVFALHANRLIHKDELTEILWPDAEAQLAAHRLQTAVSSLRSFLERRTPPGTCRIRREGPSYGLLSGRGCSVDLDEFRGALEAAAEAQRAQDSTRYASALRQALDLYPMDLLPEDGPAEWVTEPRDRVRMEASAAATGLAAELAAVDPRAALAAAEKCLDIDPYNDHAWRQVISLHTRLGDLAMAQRARRSYAQMLDELGVTEHARVATHV